MSLPKGNFDVIFENVLSILRTYSATLDAADQFEVKDDFFRPWSPPDADGRYIFAYLASLSPDQRRSSARTHFQYDVGIWLEVICLASAQRDADAGTWVSSDQNASRQCRGLVQAVLSVLYAADNLDLLTTPGAAVSTRPLIDVQPYPPEALEMEKAAVGMRINLKVGTVFVPNTGTGPALDIISASASGGSNDYGADVDVPQD